MKTMKKVLSVMLVAVMLLTAAPLNGFAGIELSEIDFDNIFSKKTQASTVASGTCGENLTWTLKDEGTLTIVGTGAMADYDYETSPFYNNSNIKSVVISNGVTSIGANAFRDCSQLTTVIMTDSITSINSFAFCSCSALDNVVIPPNVTVLKQGAFASCAGLKTITIPASVTTFENSVFRYVELSDINYSGSEDDWNAIENLGRNEGIGSATIHYNYSDHVCITACEIIDYDRYTDNQGDSCVFHLDKSGLPGSDNAYYRNGNIGIDGTEYNNGLEVWIARLNYKNEISWASATYNLESKYKTLTGKTGIINSYNTSNFDTTIYFYNGDNLIKSYNLTNNNYETEIAVDVSGVNELKIMVKDNVAVSGGTSFAFYDMFLETFSAVIASGVCGDNLTWLLDTNGILTIAGTGKMYDYFRDSDTSTFAPWHEHCDLIKSANIGPGVENIGGGAFEDCSIMKTITISKSITDIGSASFFDCVALNNIYYSGSREDWNAITIGSYNSSLLNATIHFYGDNGIQDVVSGTCGENLTWTLDVDGTLTIAGTGEMENYPPQYSPFSCSNMIKRIIICEGVTSIGTCAFHYSSATTVSLPSTVKKIELSAFFECPITSFTVDEENEEYTSENGVLYNKDKSTLIRYPIGKEYSTFSIPQGVETIGDSAFSQCRLKSIVLPNSVTTIESGAFQLCTSLSDLYISNNLTDIGDSAFLACNSLQNVYYSGSEEQWKKINIYSDNVGNDDLFNATIHYNYSGATFSQPIYMASIWSGIHDKDDSETPESSMLDWLHGKIKSDDIKYTPICGIITDSLKNNSSYQTALQAWEDVQTIAAPSYQIDKYSSLNDIYIGIILSSVMNVLESDSFEELLNGKLESDTLDWTKTISSIAKELYGIDDYAAYFKDSKTASDFKQKNSDIVVKAYEKRAGKQMNAEFIAETTGVISEIIKIANSSTEFLARLTAFMTIAETRNSMKQLLNDLADHTNMLSNGYIMANAFEMVSAATEDGLTAAMTAVCDMLLHDGVLMISSEIIDKTWSYASAAFPFLQGVQIGAKIGTAICNAFMATEDSIVAYYTAKATYEFYEILQNACDRNESAYLNTTTEETSSVYLDAERLFVAALQLDLVNGLKYFDIACNQGLVNVVNNWIDGGNANYESIKESTESLDNSLSDFKTLLEISWILGHSYLRTDYPEVFESYIKHIFESIPESTPNIYSIRVLPSGQLQIRFTGNIMLNAEYPLLDGYEVYVKKNDGEFVFADEIYSYKPSSWSQEITINNTDFYTVKLRSFVDTADEGRIYSSFSPEKTISASPAVTPVISTTYNSLYGNCLKIENPSFRSLIFSSAKVETVVYRRSSNNTTATEIARIPHLFTGQEMPYVDLATILDNSTYYYSAETVYTYEDDVFVSKRSDEIAIKNGENSLMNFIATSVTQPTTLSSRRVGNSSDNGVKLSWNALSGIARIDIHKKYEHADDFVLLTKLDGNTTSYIDTTVADGSTYEYYIALYQTIDGKSVLCGTSEPISVTTPDKARITWIVGDQVDIQYVTVGSPIIIPEFNLKENSKIIGWSSEIPKTASAGTYTFTASLSNSVILGDIDNDGQITSSDARTTLRAAVGLDILTEKQTLAADVDKDGAVTSSDARSILRCAVGLETFDEQL